MALIEIVPAYKREDEYGLDFSQENAVDTLTSAVDPSDDDFDDADLDDDDDLNTGDEHMGIDEEGAEVDPDDQV